MLENLALGSMSFGTVLSEEDSFDLLDRFVDAGGSWIDTANCYAFWEHPSGFGGQSEVVLGRWLARRPGMRDRIRISTKVGCEPLVAGGFPQAAEGLSSKAIVRALEGSLRRLGTDRVEFYWAHMEDHGTPLEETVAAFGDLVAAGLVARLGCSNHAVWRVERARSIASAAGLPGFTAVQQQYSFLKHLPGYPGPVAHRFGCVNDEVLNYVECHPEMEIWAYSPLLSGRYVRPDKPLGQEYQHPGTERRLAVLDAVVAESGTDRNQVVLSWLAHHSPRVIPIVGMSTRQHLEIAVAGATLRLSAEQYARLSAAR